MTQCCLIAANHQKKSNQVKKLQRKLKNTKRTHIHLPSLLAELQERLIRLQQTPIDPYSAEYHDTEIRKKEGAINELQQVIWDLQELQTQKR